MEASGIELRSNDAMLEHPTRQSSRTHSQRIRTDSLAYTRLLSFRCSRGPALRLIPSYLLAPLPLSFSALPSPS
eukprot:6177704-Pleurochrysis_carterae.AAC.1